METLTSLNPLRLDPAPDYDQLTPIAAVRPVGPGGVSANATPAPATPMPSPTVAAQAPLAQVAAVNPLISALDRLRLTQQLRPVDDEFIRLQRGMRYYRRQRRRADDELEPSESVP